MISLQPGNVNLMGARRHDYLDRLLTRPQRFGVIRATCLMMTNRPYIKRRPSGWTHGGLSPEETIVPLLHLSAEPMHVLPLELELRGTLRAGQAGTITCLLRNLNSFPLTTIQLVISGGVSEARLEQLGPSATHELELAVAPVHASGATLPVTYEVRYEIFGNPQHDTGSLNIQLRRLQTEDTAFDDMFN
jgi:hypothetical protein